MSLYVSVALKAWNGRERGLDRSGSDRGKWPAVVITVMNIMVSYLSSQINTGFTGRAGLCGV